MCQRGLLFCPECQAPTSGGGVTIPRCRRETMPLPSSKPIAGAFQPLLGVDHIARGKAVLAASVLAQRHQLGAGPHRAHHLVELVLAVAVPERELRQVAPRERRLLPRDTVERDFRIGDDLLAILARDPRMILDPLRLKALFGHTRCRWPDLVLRLQVDPLCLQGAMIYAGINIQLGKPLVDMVRPCLAPPLQQLGSVPLADLLPEPFPVHLAHRQHDMRVGLGHPILAHVPMDIEVRDHAAFDKLLFDKFAGERDALHLIHFARNRELYLAGKLRVLPDLPRLDLVPQGRAVV